MPVAAVLPRPSPPSGAAPTFTIGELAREFGVTTRAIRFYEDCGLLEPTRESGSFTVRVDGEHFDVAATYERASDHFGPADHDHRRVIGERVRQLFGRGVAIEFGRRRAGLGAGVGGGQYP